MNKESRAAVANARKMAKQCFYSSYEEVLAKTELEIKLYEKILLDKEE